MALYFLERPKLLAKTMSIFWILFLLFPVHFVCILKSENFVVIHVVHPTVRPVTG